MPSPRDVLNGLRWQGADAAAISLAYRHRGAPGDVRIVTGTAIRAVSRLGIELNAATRGTATVIPYHRVLRISYHGEVLFDRGRLRLG